MTTFRFLVCIFSCAVLYLSASTAAVSQSACSFYTARDGDTLRRIATASKSPGGYQLIYSANVEAIRDAGGMGPGVELRIPCPDGSLPTRITRSLATTAGTSTKETLRFLTAGDYAPFTDENAREGGLFSELVARSMRAGAPGTDFDIVFVNDWGAHLNDLLPYDGFDLGFPWFLPDCTRLERLSPANRIRCTEYDASDPFFEAVVSYYAGADSAYQDARSTQDLRGARLCRPDGWFTFDLEAVGLVVPVVDLIQPASQHDCWRLLQAGQVDIVTFEALAAEEDIANLGLLRDIKEIVPLATVETLHVFSHKSHPTGLAELAALNAGLKILRDNGEWYEIVADQMREHVERKSAQK